MDVTDSKDRRRINTNLVISRNPKETIKQADGSEISVTIHGVA
jgi:hypothetical protein